jgi:hypothetical protein
MSRWYGMQVRIGGFPSAAIDQIKQAAESEWPFEDWTGDGQTGELSSYAEDKLCGGEEEAEFTERLALAIWQAAGAYCEVTVNATYLEDLPCESYSLDEDDYVRLIEGQASISSTGDPSDEDESP